EETFEDAIDEIERALASAADADTRYDFTYEIGYPPMCTDASHSWIGQVLDVANEVSDRKIDIAGAQGSLDVAYVIGITEQPVCCHGVGRVLESHAHAEDENVRLEDLVRYTKFLWLLLTE
ncbi:MAG: M20/M25/M40 family metallo-hydrolase, partial [Methanosarcinales archaeon]|nr:M20/M25/M40 family metallo-hydrolase [Methanosarcinales archaeon]